MKAIDMVENNKFNPGNVAEQLKVYSWHYVSSRTEKVYWKCIEMPKSTYEDRIYRYLGCGGICSRLITVAIATMAGVFLYIIEWMVPREGIETPAEWSQYARVERERDKTDETRKE